MALMVIRSKTRVSLLLNPQSLSAQILRSLSTTTAVTAFVPRQSLRQRQIAVAKLLQRYGFPIPQVSDFISKYRFLVNSDLGDLEKSLSLLFYDLKIPQKDLASMVMDCPGVLDYGFLRNWELGFSQSGLSIGSPSMVVSLLEHSRKYRLGSGVEVLRELGFSDKTVARVLECFPRVASMAESEIRMKVRFLEEILIPKEGIDRILRFLPRILGFSVEKRLIPLLSEFKALGFKDELIRREIEREPEFLGFEVGEFSRCLEFLRNLNCRDSIKARILFIGEFRAGFELKIKVDYFWKLGLTHREVFSLLSSQPILLTREIKDFEKKVEFLVKRQKLGIHCLLDAPEYLVMSLEFRILPRFKVIDHLMSRGGLRYELSLKDYIRPNRIKFYNLYVKPYPEYWDIYPLYQESPCATSRLTEGFWKNFKPQKHEKTTEDIENMKSFIGSSV